VPYSKENRVLQGSGIGTILRSARIRRGQSQEELANSVGMSASSISHIESGSDLKTSTLLRMAAECECEVVIVPKECVRYVRAVLDDMYRGSKSWQNGE
jgi:transcriptional regulator with XRE-family HTH domain